MALPPRLDERSSSARILLAVIVPAVYGTVTGIFLGVSEAIYLVLSIAGVVGGIGAGLEHRGAAAGARRGVLAGSLFGGSILIAHELTGAEAKAELPDPAILLVVVTTALAVGLAALGGWMRERAERRGATTGGPEMPGPLG